MAKVITFSTKFPPHHPKSGQPTFFKEKILKSLGKVAPSLMTFDQLRPKIQTIRSGSRFKAGEMFSPRIWSGKPYHSKQEIIAEDIKIEHVFDFEVDAAGVYSLNGKYLLGAQGDILENRLAHNDGFDDADDLFNWIVKDYNNIKPFKGQIICWHKGIDYASEL